MLQTERNREIAAPPTDAVAVLPAAENTPPAPDQAGLRKERWGQAVRLHREGRIEEAVTAYRSLLDGPMSNHASAWINLAIALRTQHRYPAALACCRRGFELNAGDPDHLSTLGNILKDLKRLPESVAAHRAAVAARPDATGLRNNLAVALREAGELEDALGEWEETCRLEPDNEKFRLEKAFVMLYLGRFKEGWAHFEARWKTGELPDRFGWLPRWQGEDFSGRTLVVHPEQGFGDTILAARYLPLVKQRGGEVVLACKPPLARLFSNLEGVDRMVPLDDPVADGDLQSPMMSLPGIFGTTHDDIPPLPRLFIPEDARARAQQITRRGKGRFKVGVVWSGSVTFKNNRNRSVAVERFLDLAEVPGTQFFSLQKGPREHQLKDSGADAVMVDVGGRVADFAETAAVIQQLDLVIMTDSSVAHLCGSLGKPIWNLLNFAPYWLYQLGGERTPWYPSMQLVRQPRPGDWDDVFRRVKQSLTQVAMKTFADRQTPKTA